MSDNLLDRLDEIRIKRGLPTFDPTRIEGGNNFPLPSEFDPDNDPAEAPFPSVEAGPALEEPSPSPLVALGSAWMTAPPAKEPLSAPAELYIADQTALYKAQQVELSDQEQSAIASIVLKALANRIKAQHQELLAKLPKRKAVATVPTSPEAPKRKRGRPRKVRENAEAPN